jgi:hypothetical protein
MIGSVYRCKIAIALGYSAYDKNYALNEWMDTPLLSNPINGHFWLKIEPGAYFIITDVTHNTSSYGGDRFSIYVNFISPIPFEMCSKYLMAVVPKNQKYGKWTLLDPDIIQNRHIKSLWDRKKQQLDTSKIRLRLSSSVFFTLEPTTFLDKIEHSLEPKYDVIEELV